MLEEKWTKVGRHEVVASGSVILFPHETLDICIGEEASTIQIQMAFENDSSRQESRIEGAIVNLYGTRIVRIRWLNAPDSPFGGTMLDPIVVGKYDERPLQFIASIVPVHREPSVRVLIYTIRLGDANSEEA